MHVSLPAFEIPKQRRGPFSFHSCWLLIPQPSLLGMCFIVRRIKWSILGENDIHLAFATSRVLQQWNKTVQIELGSFLLFTHAYFRTFRDQFDWIYLTFFIRFFCIFLGMYLREYGHGSRSRIRFGKKNVAKRQRKLIRGEMFPLEQVYYLCTELKCMLKFGKVWKNRLWNLLPRKGACWWPRRSRINLFFACFNTRTRKAWLET